MDFGLFVEFPCRDGMTEQEVAQALGLSLGTVKTHARRGAEALRLRLGDSFKEVSFDTD